MPFPLVFCTGMLRSGSTWSFNVCRLMAKVVAGREGRPMWAGYLLDSQTENFFDAFGQRQPGPTVLKAHKLSPRGLEILRTGAARGICTFRDPRDCVASMITFAGQTFDVAKACIDEALQNLHDYHVAGNTLFIRYEEMMADRIPQIRRIAEFIGQDFDDKTFIRIDELTNKDASHHIARKLQYRPPGQVMKSMNHRVDPETWLHDNHIQSGKHGRWKEEMTPRQAELVTKSFEPWLQRLGYLDGTWKQSPDASTRPSTLLQSQ